MKFFGCFMKYFCNGNNLDGDYMGRVNYPRYVYFRCILQMSAFFWRIWCIFYEFDVFVIAIAKA